jgi:hypothetical protein
MYVGSFLEKQIKSQQIKSQQKLEEKEFKPYYIQRSKTHATIRIQDSETARKMCENIRKHSKTCEKAGEYRSESLIREKRRPNRQGTLEW